MPVSCCPEFPVSVPSFSRAAYSSALKMEAAYSPEVLIT